MSTNKNLWTLDLPSHEFVDLPHSVIHYTGIEISDICLIEDERRVLKIVGEKIKEFSELIPDKQSREHLVRAVNRTRKTLSTIFRWIESHLIEEVQENDVHNLSTTLSIVDKLIADKTLFIPLFDSRFIHRELLGQCIQTVYRENEECEKQFVSEILYPASGIRRYVQVQILYQNTFRPPLDAYRITVEQSDINGQPVDFKKLLRSI